MQFAVLASGYGLVEAPTVDEHGGVLFSDVLGGGVHRWDPAGDDRDRDPEAPRRRRDRAACRRRRRRRWSRHRPRPRRRHVAPCSASTASPGWNDLCTDSRGRVYAGALRFAVFDRDATPVPGELLADRRSGEATRLYGDVVHANGIALSPDETTIYHSDTRTHTVIVHTLRDDGTAADRRVIDTREFGQPDGMAVDEHGALWVALLGYGLGRFTPDGGSTAASRRRRR